MTQGFDISQVLGSEQEQEQQWLEEAQQRYPYFALPLLLQAKRHNSSDELLQQLALMSPDRRDLSIVLGHAPAAFATFYPQPSGATTPSTLEAIDRFLEHYAHGTNQREIDALSNAIFSPTPPDYADILAAQASDDDTVPHDKQDELISSFIEHSRQQEQKSVPQPTAVTRHVQQDQAAVAAADAINNSSAIDDSMLSESLAKMYIARGKYSKALEIIESINLNFPEKSIYFADQIRFLRKLVLIENKKTKH